MSVLMNMLNILAIEEKLTNSIIKTQYSIELNWVSNKIFFMCPLTLYYCTMGTLIDIHIMKLYPLLFLVVSLMIIAIYTIIDNNILFV